MIVLDEKWSIDMDNYNYVLQKKLTTAKKAKGREVLDENGNPVSQQQSVGYYPTLAKALDAYSRVYTRSTLMNSGDLTVAEAIKIVQKCADDMTKLIAEKTKNA